MLSIGFIDDAHANRFLAEPLLETPAQRAVLFHLEKLQMIAQPVGE
jgi:hypothetical protein